MKRYNNSGYTRTKCGSTKSSRIFYKFKIFPIQREQSLVHLCKLSTMSLVKFERMPTFLPMRLPPLVYTVRFQFKNNPQALVAFPPSWETKGQATCLTQK
jgi:hypothetical protein